MKLCKHSALVALAIIMLAVTTQYAIAQIAGTGTIQGIVTDSTGAAVSGAQVQVVEVKTNLVRSTTTSKDGFYSIAALDNGLYRLTISESGFKTAVRDNITLNAVQVQGLNITLELGEVTSSVTVTEAPAALNTTNATLGSTIDVETYKALPIILNGQPRDPTAFVALTPGVSVAGGNYQFNGGQTNTSETYVDGVAMDNANQQSDVSSIHNSFSFDAVEQSEALTSSFSAAYQGQGLQNYVHKSGTNAYHGTAFEYFRNTALDSWGFYAPYVINAVTGTAIKPVEHDNEFGGTLGGYTPHFKNKMFFFVSLETEHYIHGNNPGYTTVPTAAERTGDFTALPANQPIYDPSTTLCTGSTCTRQQFMGTKNGVATPNAIPSGEISPISEHMLSFLPAPSNNNITNNYLGGFNTGFNYPRQSYKMDIDLIKHHRLSAPFTYGARFANPACCDASGLPLPYTNTVGNSQNNLTALVSDTWTIGSRAVNRLTYDFNINGFGSGAGSINPSASNPAWYATAAGITNLPAGQASNSFPKTTFGGANAPAQWAGGEGTFGGAYCKVYQITDGFQIVKGRHSISIGGNYQWEQTDLVPIQTNTYFTLSYSNNETAGLNAAGTAVNTTQGGICQFPHRRCRRRWNQRRYSGSRAIRAVSRFLSFRRRRHQAHQQADGKPGITLGHLVSLQREGKSVLVYQLECTEPDHRNAGRAPLWRERAQRHVLQLHSTHWHLVQEPRPTCWICVCHQWQDRDPGGVWCFLHARWWCRRKGQRKHRNWPVGLHGWNLLRHF
uniref:TonB-dependent receptor n=1 Tax=Bryocella elongata TaxID=863522 RepID=UPI001F35119D|nr:carboxypeptidase-like regulatory domain-containing protein [Bryocella elongata]